ncbi:MAG TPA: AIPR family protein [Pyrinomonadaceae bacterium]|nr:AIPR family protein [Pyrinomonadaceae bacterium]
MPDFTYPAILDLFPQHIAEGRNLSASFLIWYLENYYNLDAQEATDCVCDRRGDKGVDGIFVNDNDRTITIFQATIIQNETDQQVRRIGDKAIREFDGTVNQFATPESIQAVLDSGLPSELANLINKSDLKNKIETHELLGEFLCNIDQDANADGAQAALPRISFLGKTVLSDTYISDSRDVPVHTPAMFDVSGYTVTKYEPDGETTALIAPVKGTELVALDGIANQSIYIYNVRGPLGKTGVNKGIRKSIQNKASHKQFPLFHNGITFIAKELKYENDTIRIEDYFVVNGCQSLTALYNNRADITNDLRILAKFIELEPASDLAKTVTRFSNNQNEVKERDFVANDPKQIRLQNQFNDLYRGEYFFDIKEGDTKLPGVVIRNDDAGLLLRAFDKKEPWATHRKSEVVDLNKQYSAIFVRTEVRADRIVLCWVIGEVVSAALPQLTNELVRKYNLTKYVIVYIVRTILETDDLFQEITQYPERFVRSKTDREWFRHCIEGIVAETVIDLNAELDGYGEDFDYRDKLRDEAWVKDLTRTLVADRLKLVLRKRIPSFSEVWKVKP